MYELGELKVVACEEDRKQFEEVEYGFMPYEHKELPVVWLPHSCDEWIIGGPTQVAALIVDLNLALAHMHEVA